MSDSERQDAIARGMLLAFIATQAPDRLAVASPHGERSYAELDARCNQLARALRAGGLVAGDPVALLCSNRPEFVEALGACSRSGFRVTPINWHLTAEEVGYIVDDCEAKAFIADARFAQTAAPACRHAPKATLRLSIAGEIDGFESYQDALDAQPSGEIEAAVLGTSMLYTSGTTGRPKGVFRSSPGRSSLTAPLTRTAAFEPDNDMALNTGPLYHAAPMALNLLFPLNQGVGVVLMDHWEPEETLRLIEEYGITHTHMVPTMFHRLLQLPKTVRIQYDTSGLRWIVHGAAPCPVHIKREMMDWFGPIVYEYYAATEGGGTFIEPLHWLAKPGSVGHPIDGQEIEIQDDEGKALPAEEVGTVFIKAPDSNRFEYFHAPEKTSDAYRGDYFTMGDRGFFDADGDLFLTGRSAEMIISGGVNIFPAEIDAVLLMHPSVQDVAVIGIPNDEWGEEVKAVVQLVDPGTAADSLAEALIAHCREHLAHFKCPRSVDFAVDLPRLPTGKIVRRLVREPYWAERDKSI